MKKIIILILCLLFVPAVLADGGIIIRDRDMWGMFDEEQQFAAINHKDGFQNMILTVDTSEELRGEEAVWIFPIPAKPEKTAINIIKGFPALHGYDVEEGAADAVSGSFMAMRATSIFPPLLLFSGRMGAFGKGLEGALDGVTVHERIEKMGLTTELISALDSQSFSNYLSAQDLEVPANFRSILDGYIGQEYSLVVSWISDIEEFKKEQEFEKQHYGRKYVGNKIGVFITFPTEKIYYPLKPTSVYGSKRVPAVIYVMDYVEPELYPEIRADSEVNYFLQRRFRAPEELRDFFVGFEKDPSAYYDRIDGKVQGFGFNNLRYTKIKINPPSKYLTQDLWIKGSALFRIKMAEFMDRNIFWIALLFFMICSCLASLIAAVIIFKGAISKRGFALFGLFNFLTLIGFSIASYFMRTKEISKRVKDYISKNGIKIFQSQTRKYRIVLMVFLSLIFLWLILGRFFISEFLLVLVPIIILGLFILIFNLSREELKTKYKSYFDKYNVTLKIVNIKKLIYLFFFNLIFSIGGMILIFSDYKRAEGLAKLLGFVNHYSRGVWAREENLILLVILLVFSLSVLTLIFLDKLFKDKFGIKGFHIMQKDFRKFWFVLLFVILFMILTIIFEFLLRWLIL